jgi:hypothetical protein
LVLKLSLFLCLNFYTLISKILSWSTVRNIWGSPEYSQCVFR